MTEEDMQALRARVFPLTLEEWQAERIEKLEYELVVSRNLFTVLRDHGKLEMDDRMHVHLRINGIEQVLR